MIDDERDLLSALRACVEALDGIAEMSDATPQSAFREEAWAALERVPDWLRDELAAEDPLAPSSIAAARLEEAPAPGSAAEPTPQRPSEAPAPAPRAHEKSEADPRPGGAS